MKTSVLDTVLTALKRRGFTALGTIGVAASDDWVTMALSFAVSIINEVIQGRQAHKAKKKADDA